MSKQAEAELILKLYELRREDTMRKARDWYVSQFHPQSISDYNGALFGPYGGFLRMVVSYWEMAAALVNNGAISLEMFNDTNSEHIGVFTKIEPFLKELREHWGPNYVTGLEKLIDAMPDGRKRVKEIRELMHDMRTKLS